MKKIFAVILFILITYHASGAFADRIVLNNEDRLTGTVVGTDNGILTLKTDYSTPIKIQIIKIKEIFTDYPVEVHLSEGKILKGKLRTGEKGEHYFMDSSCDFMYNFSTLNKFVWIKILVIKGKVQEYRQI